MLFDLTQKEKCVSKTIVFLCSLVLVVLFTPSEPYQRGSREHFKQVSNSGDSN